LSIRIPAEEIEVSEEVDLLVIGGGAAGCAAAVTGARLGLRTSLVGEMPFLGGMSTGGCVGSFCGVYMLDSAGSIQPLTGGFPQEITQTLLGRSDAIGPIPYRDTAVLPYVPVGLKRAFEERVRAESRLRVRLHSKLTHAEVEAGVIRGVVIQTREGRVALRARVYVDATGDAILSRMVGAPIIEGEEVQYPSMMFTMQNVDVGAAIASVPKLDEILEAHYESEGLPRKSGNLIPTGRPGEIIVALSRLELNGRPVDAGLEHELSWAELEGRHQAQHLCEFLKAKVPGFSDAFLADYAARLGVRETRKIIGEYVLCEDDVLGARDFEDGIGRSAWPIERHVAGGETFWRFLDRGQSYAIPYRCLVPRDVSNLLVAGRCLSAESAAFASVRLLGPCMLEGQAVAAAAQRMIADQASAANVDVDRLRATLTELGVPL